MVGAVLTAAAYQLPQLIIGRIILGCGVGELRQPPTVPRLPRLLASTKNMPSLKVPVQHRSNGAVQHFGRDACILLAGMLPAILWIFLLLFCS